MAVTLRELSRGDLPLLNRWRNDPELIGWLGAVFRFIAPEIDEAWYQDYLRSRDRNVRAAIEADGVFVGLVNLTGIDSVHRSAEFSILIGDQTQRSRGVGAAATGLMVDHAFRNLNLHRVYLTVLAHNERAIRLYRRVGFVDEGREREAAFKHGRYEDLLRMAILRSDYERGASPGA